jgi:hypothetical protein
MKNPNFLKIVFLIIRVLVIRSAAFSVLLFGYMSYVLFEAQALPSFIFYLIVLFPFNKLKNLTHLQIYYKVLFGSTIATICLEYLVMLQQSSELYTSFWLSWTLLAINVYIVLKYVRYKIQPELGNPIYEHKRVLIATLTLITILLIFAFQMLLPYINIRKTSDGNQFFGFPSTPGYVTTLFTDQALLSKYELASSSFSNEKLGCVILSRHQPEAGFLELISQNKPFIRVEYGDTAPNNITVFNADGSSITKEINPNSVEGQPFFYREQNGNFSEKNWRVPYDSTYIGQVKFYSLDPGMPSSYSDNQQFMAGDNFVIQVCEQFEYPVRAEGDKSKTKKIAVPWSLVLIDFDGEMELIKSNYVLY